MTIDNWYSWTDAEKELWQNMTNVHDRSKCEGRDCAYHRPTDHHMRTWPPHWRGDRGILERICSHGIGHPDPDQMPFWVETGQEWQGIHGCCGCCSEED